MQLSQIHEFARKFLSAHGKKAEAQAAIRAHRCEQQGDEKEAEDWRRIRAALQEMRGPHVS